VLIPSKYIAFIYAPFGSVLVTGGPVESTVKSVRIGFSALWTALAKNVRPLLRLVAQTRKEQLIRRLLFRGSQIYPLLVWRSVDRTNFLIAFKFLGILLPNGGVLVAPRRE